MPILGRNSTATAGSSSSSSPFRNQPGEDNNPNVKMPSLSRQASMNRVILAKAGSSSSSNATPAVAGAGGEFAWNGNSPFSGSGVGNSHSPARSNGVNRNGSTVAAATAALQSPSQTSLNSIEGDYNLYHSGSGHNNHNHLHHHHHGSSNNNNNKSGKGPRPSKQAQLLGISGLDLPDPSSGSFDMLSARGGMVSPLDMSPVGGAGGSGGNSGAGGAGGGGGTLSSGNGGWNSDYMSSKSNNGGIGGGGGILGGGMKSPKTSAVANTLGSPSDLRNVPSSSPANLLALRGSKPNYGGIRSPATPSGYMEAGWNGSPSGSTTPTGGAAIGGVNGTPVSKATPQSASSQGKEKQKKRGFLGGLLKGKSSRSDFKEDSQSHAEFAAGIPASVIPSSFANVPLPAKLQARGDTADPFPHRLTALGGEGSLDKSSSSSGRNLKSSKKTRRDKEKPSTPTSRNGSAGLGSSQTLSGTKSSSSSSGPFGPIGTGSAAGGFMLDTNLDSMEGIVNLDAIHAVRMGSGPPGHGHGQGVGGSPSPSFMARVGGAARDGVSPTDVDFDRNALGVDADGVPISRRGSSGTSDMGARYDRNGDMAPTGGLEHLEGSGEGLLGEGPRGLGVIGAGGYWSPLGSAGGDPASLATRNGSPARSGVRGDSTASPFTVTGFPGHSTASPGGSGMPPARPGMGQRSSSALSVNTFYAASSGAGTDRRPSIVTPLAPAKSALSSAAAGGGGAWQAPDSWAVKEETGAIEHDSSEEDDDDGEDEDDDENHSTTDDPNHGANDDSPLKNRDAGTFGGAAGTDHADLVNGNITNGHVMHGLASRNASVAGLALAGGRGGLGMGMGGRPGTSSGRPSTRSGRPSTADGSSRMPQKNFMIRIFRPDGTFTTLPVPLTTIAAELTSGLAKRLQINAKAEYALYLREKGIERRVGPNEKPVLLQKRRFEQAGYSELDRLEELGREDNSYLCKLVYKATQAAIPIGEEDFGFTHEFVNLSARGVETVPIFLYKHAHEIVSLNLSKNRPFDLPTDFVQICTSLRELVLSHMGIKRIPQAVRQCISLTRLDISNNHIVDLDHIALDEVSSLSSLKCHNNRLWSLPEYFSRFEQLKYLNLSNNRFDSIPNILCEVKSLVELDVSFNTITTVQQEIGRLENLERLVLLANTINSLPTTFSNLTHLKELDCRRNAIADLSPISAIPQLEVLKCEYNQASVLDATWSHMRILSASNNSITRFALAGTGTTLTSLNLSYAKLSSLATDMFDHLGSVEILVFDSNQIRVLPEGVGSLTNLVTLSIKNNLLDELPTSIGRLQRLQTLQLSGNNLHALPSQIWLCSQLMTLNASSNLMKDFPDPPLAGAQMESSVDELDVRKLSTVSKAPSTASGRITPPLALCLQKLYLGDNRLGDDVFAPISLMTELRTLNLSFNDIYEIPPSSLFKCQQLEELYLSGNKLTSLPPDDLERLVNIKLIYLNGNKLQTLPAELGKIKRLFALDVGSNVLKYNIANWPYDWNWNWNLELRYLNLSGNKRLEIKPGHQNDTSNLPRSAKRRNLADFSALTKLHILGLMDVTLMIPSVPDESEDRRVRTSQSDINDMGYGIADTLGARVDTLSLVDIVIPRFRSKDDEAIFGLFDAVNKGQNTGAKLVKYLQDSFTAVFTLELSRLKIGEVTSDALRRAFLAINRDYGNQLLPALESRRKDSDISLTDRSSASVRTGAAGVIVYIRKKHLYVANAGNALAVIAGRGGSARLISKAHDPFEATEIQRIRTSEGWISHRGYVNDEVDVSRSFGFYNVFPAINASPNIDEIELADTDEFVIIANRGLWEHMSYQTAVDVARTERGDPMTAAAKLRDLAISYGSTLNVMVMVLAVGDLFKAKKDYRFHRGIAQSHEEEGFYGAHKSGAAMRREKEDGAGERYLNLLDREVPPPVGLLCLVFTDIRNSTALWESNPGMQTAIRMHNQLLRRQLRAIGGYEVKTEGDAFMVSFPSVPSALLWCLTVQLELLREDWPQEILDSEEGKEITNSQGDLIYRGLSVRMGLHWGAPVCEADPITRRMDYFGPMVNRTARISAVAEGGQISCSQDIVSIIQEIIIERKPARDSLDSDSGQEEEEEWLDQREKQDVLALRRLGFGISELGERKLKGLETADTISLIWPKTLKDRVKAAGNTLDKPQQEVFEPSTQLIDVSLVRALIRVCYRLELAAASLVHSGALEEKEVGASPMSPATESNQQQLALNKRKTYIHPSSVVPIIRPDATDEELHACLELYIIRIENCLSTLVLHQLGEFTEVLAALGGALRLDPKYIMTSLSRYRTLMATK